MGDGVEPHVSVPAPPHGDPDPMASRVQLAFDKLADSENFNRVARGLQVIRASPEGLLTELTLREAHLNRKGTLHGGQSAALVDILTGWAVGLVVERIRLFSVELSVSYLNTAVAGETVSIEAKCLRVAEKTAYAEAEIRRPSDGEIIARGRNTLAIVGSRDAGRVIRGYGRGGRTVNCPTANLEESTVARLPPDFVNGVYAGFLRLRGGGIDHGDLTPMVMSVGFNPQFRNKKKTLEVHILRTFEHEFYGAIVEGVAVRFIRPMQSYKSIRELIDAIDSDKREAAAAMDDRLKEKFQGHNFFA